MKMKIGTKQITLIIMSLIFISALGFVAVEYISRKNQKIDVAIPFCEFRNNTYFKPNRTLEYEIGINITTFAENKFMGNCCVAYDNTSKYYVLLDCPIFSPCFNKTCTLEESK